MKTMHLFIIFIFSIFLTSTISRAQYEQCGYDYNCYYEIKERMEEERRNEAELREERYRQQKLQLEEEQLREVENQTELLEQQVEEQQYEPYDSSMPPIEAP